MLLGLWVQVPRSPLPAGLPHQVLALQAPLADFLQWLVVLGVFPPAVLPWLHLCFVFWNLPQAQQGVLPSEEAPHAPV